MSIITPQDFELYNKRPAMALSSPIGVFKNVAEGTLRFATNINTIISATEVKTHTEEDGSIVIEIIFLNSVIGSVSLDIIHPDTAIMEWFSTCNWKGKDANNLKYHNDWWIDKKHRGERIDYIGELLLQRVILEAQKRSLEEVCFISGNPAVGFYQKTLSRFKAKTGIEWKQNGNLFTIELSR